MLQARKKHILAIDCDDVLIETGRAMLPYYNQHFKQKGLTPVRFEQITDSIDKVFQIPEEEAFSAWKQFVRDAHDTIQPVKGAVLGLEELMWHGYELHLVTARSPYLRQVTLELLTSYDLLQFFANERIHFVGTDMQLHPSKVAMCGSIDASVLIDDMPHHARDVSAAGTEVLLLERPWNLGVEAPGIRRVTSWQEITEVLVAKMAA